VIRALVWLAIAAMLVLAGAAFLDDDPGVTDVARFPRLTSTWEPADLEAPLSFPELDAFASKFAMRKVKVECTTAALEPELYGAWAIVVPVGKPGKPKRLGQAKKTSAEHDPICTGALALADPAYPDWKKAIAVLVLIHESYHLRRDWPGAADEGETECRAIRHFKVGLRLLGGTERDVDELYPLAFWAHGSLTAMVDLWGQRPYWLPGCEVELPW
jgi:hypothetical protein